MQGSDGCSLVPTARQGEHLGRDKLQGAAEAGLACVGDEDAMSDLFGVEGVNLDRGFEDLRAA